MPLAHKATLPGDTTLCLWHITEDEQQLACPGGPDLTAVKSPSRRLETLAVYALLRETTGDSSLTIGHDPSGKPTLPGANISVSHTRGWAAIIVSPTRNVAVDIEYMSDRVSRIASRFIRDDEQQDTVERQLVNWCAKEATYKYYSAEQLEYFEMRLKHYPMQTKGLVEVENLKSGHTLNVCYERNENFVLAYAVEETATEISGQNQQQSLQ